MRGLLIAPPLESRFQMYPPMGLMSLYQVARERHDLSLHDLSFSTWREIEGLFDQPLDFVGITCSYTTYFWHFVRVVQSIRKKQPDVIVIAGGNHATFDYASMLDHGVDIVVRHEGEKTFADLLNALELDRHTDLSRIPGIAWRNSEGAIRLNPERELIRPLDSLPIPDWNSLDLSRYPHPYARKVAIVETSRGCVEQCTFCSTVKMWQSRWRPKTPERVAEEFRSMAAHGIESAVIADDNFTIDEKRVAEICRLLIEQKNPVRWVAAFYPKSILRAPYLPDLMAAANCEVVLFSLDNANSRIIEAYKRPETAEVWVPAARALQRAGIAVNMHVLIGYPDESEDEMVKTIELGKQLANSFMVGILEPRPGSSFWKPGLFEDKYETFGQNVSLLHQNPRMVERLQREAMMEFYTHPRTLKRMLVSDNEAERFTLRWHARLSLSYLQRKAKARAEKVLGRYLPGEWFGDGLEPLNAGASLARP